MSLAAAQRAKDTPNGHALIDERQSIGWAELDEILNRATNALLGVPFTGERRAAIFASNAVEVPIAHIAALQAGLSTVPVNFHLTIDELEYILRDSNAEVMFVGPETVDVGLAAAARAGISLVIGWRCAPQAGLTRWAGWIDAASSADPPTGLIPRPHLHYTSGTTGRPKGAQTPPTLFPAAATVGELFVKFRERFEGAGSLSPALVVSPVYHTGPLTSIRQFGGGQALVLLSQFDAEAVLAAIETHRIEATVMVPTHFQRLLALPEDVRGKYDVSSLKQVYHTGAACPRDVKAAMIAWLGPKLFEAYGATESGTTNVISSVEWLERPGSVGRTLPPFELMILSEEGLPLGPNDVGQIYFRDTTGRGIQFHNNAEQTREAHREPGVFTLGEVGYHDHEGYLFITDRVSDMIVSGGVNIYPAEVEKVLIEHPDIADVAVIGVPNADFGEEVKALVIPRDSQAPPTQVLLDAFCRERMAGYKCPRSFEFLSDIGRNAMGKVNKRELRRPFWPSDRTIGG